MRPRIPKRVINELLQTSRRMKASHSVLIVEDDPQIGRLVTTQLREMDCEVAWVQDGIAGLHLARNDAFDLLILDLMLPRMDGLEVCRQIRAVDPFLPILMLTAKASKRDVVRGLEMGADDYLTKPFSTPELLARIQAIFRRIATDRQITAERPASEPLHRGALAIYPDLHKVTLDDRRVELTAKEYDLLLLFARHPGRAFSRRELLSEVWGVEFEGYDHTVNTHINRLRSKIEPDTSAPTYIQTVWGVGYRFAELEELYE